jgi:predicted ester cyclase
VIDHQIPEGMPKTRESGKQFIKSFRAAFPDLAYKIEFTVAEGDRVLQYATASGTRKAISWA